MTSIVWHRGDLRVHDHPALWAAQHQGTIIPLVIIDSHIFERATLSPRRKAFFLANVAALRARYRELGTDVVVREGKPETIIPQLVEEWQAEALHFLQSYSPYGKQRDAAVTHALTIPVYAHSEGISMRAPDIVLNKVNAPYKVYSPFKRAWRALPPLEIVPTPERLESLPSSIQIGDIPTVASDIPLPATGEHAAMAQLEEFLTRVSSYSESRDHISASQGTSQLSAHFTIGVLSARFAFLAAQKHYKKASDGVIRWQDELIWRDFNHYLLHHFPHTITQPFKENWRDFPWRDAPEDFEHWKNAQTGYPLVDAGIRELQETGYIHNRVRMVLASFLTKHLMIDWRKGEAYFKSLLFDADTANNIGNWQWTAGSGADAQPYFRIFNPMTQVTKFSAQDYIRRFLPQLAALDDKSIAMPSSEQRKQCHYPEPIVVHKEAREYFLHISKGYLNP